MKKESFIETLQVLVCLLFLFILWRTVTQFYKQGGVLGLLHKLQWRNISCSANHLQKQNLETYIPQLGDILLSKYGNSWKNIWPFNHVAICVEAGPDGDGKFLECQWSSKRRGFFLLKWKSIVRPEMIEFMSSHSKTAYRFHVRRLKDPSQFSGERALETAEKICKKAVFAHKNYFQLVTSLILGAPVGGFLSKKYGFEFCEDESQESKMSCTASVATVLQKSQTVVCIENATCTPYSFSSTSRGIDKLAALYCEDMVLHVNDLCG